ncbi:hypothetical protein D3C72_139370 [compost metagenome]
MLLQITVFMQPLLPEKFQFSLVCVTISDLKAQIQNQELHHQHVSHHHDVDTVKLEAAKNAHHHQLDHQCMFCTAYGHLVTNLEIDLNPILDRIQIRLMSFQKAFKHVYFVLQRLFLTPQGRAPPLFA